MSRAVFRRLGYEFFAKEENLNLMSRKALTRAVNGIPGWTFEIVPAYLLGWTSNLMLIATRNDAARMPPLNDARRPG